MTVRGSPAPCATAGRISSCTSLRRPSCSTATDEPVDTFDVNVVGTAVVLDVLRTIDRPCAVVVVTSDKCYANDESGRRFAEGDPLGGDDPYSASKAGTELVAAAYRRVVLPARADLDRHGVALATARAGNVIGGGDWTPHGMVADIVRSVGRGEPVRCAAPPAIRPWQHVLEPFAGYLTLAARLSGPDRAEYCDAWNFGPLPEDDATVGAADRSDPSRVARGLLARRQPSGRSARGGHPPLVDRADGSRSLAGVRAGASTRPSDGLWRGTCGSMRIPPRHAQRAWRTSMRTWGSPAGPLPSPRGFCPLGYSVAVAIQPKRSWTARSGW